jgi:LPS sulfotransferase NodH
MTHLFKPRIHAHETEILEFFGGDVSKTRITSKLPGKGVFVLFSNRCGSNYLVELMKQLPTLTMRNEIFNAQTVAQVCTNRGFNDFDHYLRFMRRGCKTPHWGAKLGCVQLDMVQRFGLFEAFQEGAHLIWLKRKNVVAQAVSLYIAHHNRQWASFHKVQGETPPYNFRDIKAIAGAVLRNNMDAELSLSLLNISYHALWYEDYLADTDQHMRRIADYLGEPYAPVDETLSDFKQQTDPIKTEYEERFREQARNRLDIENLR